jgi:hypothetical protein
MATFVTPRLKVIADRDTLHAVGFSRNRDLYKLTRGELFS